MALINDNGCRVSFESQKLIDRVLADLKKYPPDTPVYAIVWNIMDARFIREYCYDNLPVLRPGESAYITTLSELWFRLEEQNCL